MYCCHWIRGQYWEAIGPMALAEGSWKCPPPGTCTGTDTPGEIRPVVKQSPEETLTLEHRYIRYISLQVRVISLQIRLIQYE